MIGINTERAGERIREDDKEGGRIVMWSSQAEGPEITGRLGIQLMEKRMEVGVRGGIQHLAEMLHFKNSIPMNQQMNKADAISHLAIFHDTSLQNIRDSFLYLRQDTDEHHVVFTTGMNNGSECVSLEGQDESGTKVWSHYMDEITGQRIHRTG